jgi:hypothetical protein
MMPQAATDEGGLGFRTVLGLEQSTVEGNTALVSREGRIRPSHGTSTFFLA